MTETTSPLDNQVWPALGGADQRFALLSGDATRYHPDVSMFAAVRGHLGGEGLRDLAHLASEAHPVALFNAGALPGWTTVATLRGHQMASSEVVAPSPGPGDIVALGAEDVPDMLRLTALTKPGPFSARTFELAAFPSPPPSRSGATVRTCTSWSPTPARYASTAASASRSGLASPSPSCIRPHGIRSG
jgi:hypothetical protein